MRALWVTEVEALARVPEAALRFSTAGGRPLTIASNLPYEVWLDGVFLGDGGQRCVAGEALADEWPEASLAKRVTLRVSWLNPESCGVTYRGLFADPFLADLGQGAPDARGWTCELEAGLTFGSRASGHLARQNVFASTDREALSACEVERPGWRAIHGALRRARYVPVTLRTLGSTTFSALGSQPFEPADWEADACLVRWLRESRCALECQTFDLGAIALHRFELEASATPTLLAYSEEPDPRELWTQGRLRVPLADASAAGLTAQPLGQRGCRYVHLFTPSAAAIPTLCAWRREYPIRWRELEPLDDRSEAVVRAARANLVACVDGGLVDSCWRERVQWTGDARMSAIALRALGEAPETIDLALRQIAASYDPQQAMVKGAWPSSLGSFMPTYHLAFCLAALEQSPDLSRDPEVRHVVEDSAQRWSEGHLREGLIGSPPGWCFTDWEQGALETMGWALEEGAPHAILCAWWSELCVALGRDSGLDVEAFERTFACGPGYLISPAGSRAARRERAAGGSDRDALYRYLPQRELRPSVHATAAALNAGLVSTEREPGAVEWLVEEWREGRLVPRVTPYFSYFVACALARQSLDLARAFVLDVYGPEAERYGTISEKGSPDDSRAHGWSVAAVSLLLP
jgi:hypothetical protein